MGLKISRRLPFLVLFFLFAAQLPVCAQSVPCAAITRNPLVLEALLDSHSKEAGSNLQDETINAAQLGRLRFSPIIIQPGDALYVEYRGRDFVIKADFASGERTEFDSSPKGSYDQWRKGILPLDMFRAALNQRLIRLRSIAKNPNQVAFRNIKIVRAGLPVFEFAKLATYERTQRKTVARKELPCKGVEEYPNTETAFSQANLLVPAGNAPKAPLTFTVQEINSMVLEEAPLIRPGDFMAFEANRRDFTLRLLLSNGKEIVTEPLSKEDAEDTSVAWRKAHIRLDYPEAMNQRIIRQRVAPLHQGGAPLLLKGMKIDGNRRLIFELEKSQPGIAKPKPIEPPMSYPPDPRVMTASATTGNIWGHPPDAGFLAPKLPPYAIHPMMSQSTITTSTGDQNHYKWNGKEFDAETGLLNFGARYYNSALGRFMTPDPKMISAQRMFDPQQWNMYTYGRNNPTTFIDPDGKELQYANTADKKALHNVLVNIARRPGGLSMLKTLSDSKAVFTLHKTEKGELGGTGYYGLTAPAGQVTYDHATGKDLQGTIELKVDLDQRKADQDMAQAGVLDPKKVPPSDEQTIGHELTHGERIAENPKQYLATPEAERERDADENANNILKEKPGDKKEAGKQLDHLIKDPTR